MIVVVFVLCWLPFFILNVVNLVFILPENSLMAGVYFFVVTLTYVNSCANPLLYGFVGNNFRRNLLRLLRCAPDSRAGHAILSSKMSALSYRASEALRLNSSKKASARQTSNEK